jgi:hypothetical protein
VTDAPLCPHCQQPVAAGAMYCPHCGFRLAPEVQPRATMGRGLSWMIGGLVLFGLAGFTFFASCLGGIGGAPATQVGMIASAVLALSGIVAMGVGVVLALRELLRR